MKSHHSLEAISVRIIIISLMEPIFVPNYKKALCCLRGNVLLKVNQAPPLQRVAVSILLSLGHISTQRGKKRRNMKGKTQRKKSNLSTGGRRGLHPAEALMLFWTRIHTDRHVLYILKAAPVVISPSFCPLSPSVLYHSRTVCTPNKNISE